MTEITQNKLCSIGGQKPSKKDGMCHSCLQTKYDAQEWRWMDRPAQTAARKDAGEPALSRAPSNP